MSGLPLALRFALREMRGGLKGFRIFLACIAIGVAAIAAAEAQAGHIPRRYRKLLLRPVGQYAENCAGLEACDPHPAVAIDGEAIAIGAVGQQGAIGEAAIGAQVIGIGAKPAFVDIESSTVGADPDAVGNFQALPEQRGPPIRVETIELRHGRRTIRARQRGLRRPEIQATLAIGEDVVDARDRLAVDLLQQRSRRTRSRLQPDQSARAAGDDCAVPVDRYAADCGALG